MADIIDFLTTALQDNVNRALGKDLVSQLNKPGITAEGLLTWFKANHGDEVTLEQCKKIIANKDHIAHATANLIADNY